MAVCVKSVLGVLFKLLAQPFEIFRGGALLVKETCTCRFLDKPRPYLAPSHPASGKRGVEVELRNSGSPSHQTR